MSTPHWLPGQLRELSRSECLGLVATKSVGRIAYAGPDGPEVVPVNFVLQHHTVLFATSPHSLLGRQLGLDVAAFQVDDIDDDSQSGWSVLLRGRVEPVDTDDLPPAAARPHPWAAGQRSLRLRLVPRTTTGRRLLPDREGTSMPQPASTTVPPGA